MPRKESIEEFQAGHGVVGAAAAVVGVELEITKYVIIKADLTNTNNVFVGTAAVSATNGFMLDAGESTPPIQIDNLGKVFVIGDAAAQGYSWLVV